MANTLIQLKYSTSTGNVPVSLANGEIAINGVDGKIFYSTPSGTIQSIRNYPGPSGLNTEIQFNDSGTMGANSSLSFNKTTGVLNTNAVLFDGIWFCDTSTVTTTSTTQTVLATFPIATYGSGKFLIQATQGSIRQVTEILLATNGTTVDATEYGTINTGASLFSVEVDVSAGNVRVLITSTSATSTAYKTSMMLLGV
jgi:hypothetical protein